MYNPGRLNKKVQIWGKIKAIDSEGNQEIDVLNQEIDEPVCISTVWAEIVPKTGSMLSGRAADTVLSRTTHMIKIRYKAEYERLKASNNWLVYDGHRFNIDYILNPYFSNEFLEIFCNEVI